MNQPAPGSGWRIVEFEATSIPVESEYHFILRHARMVHRDEATTRRQLVAGGGVLPLTAEFASASFVAVSVLEVTDLGRWWSDNVPTVTPPNADMLQHGVLVFGHDGQPFWTIESARP